MTTASEMINSSAKMAGILAEGQTLESGIQADALSRLNRMFARWANNGINLDLPTLIASDTIYVDTADEEAIELSLALRLMVKHRRPIAPGLSESADTMVTELQSKYSVLPEMKLDLAITRKQPYNINNG